MRKVIVSTCIPVPRSISKIVVVGEATFHQFGVCYDEFESGPGNYSTAIVEWPDGRIENVPVHLIKFVEPS